MTSQIFLVSNRFAFVEFLTIFFLHSHKIFVQFQEAADTNSKDLLELDKNYVNCDNNTNIKSENVIVNVDPLEHSNVLETKVEQQLESHVKTVQKHKCDSCSKLFSQLRHLKNHIKAVHEHIKTQKCDECGKLFSTKFILRRHIQNVHEGQRNYKVHEDVSFEPSPSSLYN